MGEGERERKSTITTNVVGGDGGKDVRDVA